MIVRLTGTLLEVEADSVIMERDGIAWEVLVSAYSIGELAANRGKTITLYTNEFYEGNQASGHLVPRLLGFLHAEDRLFFTRFVKLKGFGPRKALKALAVPIRQIASWIEAGDVKALSGLPGIGPRGAQLVIASLKGKMQDLAIPGAVVDGEPAVVLGEAQRDALEVLVAWGDPRTDAQRWLERAMQLQPDLSAPEDWVRLAYRVKTGVEG